MAENNLATAFVLIIGVMAYAVMFAVNSSVHSYLIVSYSDKVTGDKKERCPAFNLSAADDKIWVVSSFDHETLVGLDRRNKTSCPQSYPVWVVNHQSLHAPLLCSQDQVAMDLGFYYMANAMGRLVGVLVGGFLYHYTVSLGTVASGFVLAFREAALQ